MKREPLARALVRICTAIENPRGDKFHDHFAHIELQRLTQFLQDRLHRKVMGAPKSLKVRAWNVALYRTNWKDVLEIDVGLEDGTRLLFAIRPTFSTQYDISFTELQDEQREWKVLPDPLEREMQNILQTFVEVYDQPMWPYSKWFHSQLEELDATAEIMRAMPTPTLMIRANYCNPIMVMATQSLTHYLALHADSRQYLCSGSKKVLDHLRARKENANG